MKQFSSGPWRTNVRTVHKHPHPHHPLSNSETVTETVIETSRGVQLAQVFRSDEESGGSLPFHENGRLMAAGPDLVEALQLLMHRMRANELIGREDMLGQDDQAAYDKAANLLARMRGE